MELGDFSENAAVYEAARPGYPPELVDQMIADAGVGSGGHVAEIGAGTGKFTRLLDERGLHVVAIEPNEAMRSMAPEMPNVTWIEGTFTETGLITESQDWVVASQSFHWANPVTDLPELRRVLKPDHRLTIFWNDRQNDKHPALQRTVEIIAGIVPEFDELYRQQDWSEVLTSTGDFSDVIFRQQEHTFSLSHEQFLNFWRSHNRFTFTAGAKRREQALEKIGEYLDSLADKTLEIPLVCRAWSARRV